MRFASDASLAGYAGAWRAAEIEAEPMLLGASFEFARERGGPITHALLEHVPDGVRERVLVDSRTHMLMRGWYPCVPGWHHDDVVRSPATGQPVYDGTPPFPKHMACVFDAVDEPTASLTEFLVGNIQLPWPIPDGVNVYAAWDSYINTMQTRPTTLRAGSGEVMAFNADTIHRGVPAIATGWRFFIRATWDTTRPVINKIRKNANVYMPAISGGW